MTLENHIPDDDLVLFALQLLPDERMTQAMAHLQTCEPCRAEIAKIQGDLAAYSMTAPPEPPPPSSRDRFMRQLAREPRIAELPPFQLKPTEYELQQAELRQAEEVRRRETLTLTPRPDSRTVPAFAERTPDRIQDRIQDRTQDRFPDRIQERVQDRFPDRIQDRTQDTFPERTQDRSPDRIPERIPERIQDRIQDTFSDRVPERTQDRIQDLTQDTFPDRIQGRTQDRTQDRIPDRIQDRPPDRIQDRLIERVRNRAEERHQDQTDDLDHGVNLSDRRSSQLFSSEPVFSARQSRVLTRGTRRDDPEDVAVYREERRSPGRAPWAILAWTGWAVAAGCSFVAGLQVHQRQQVQSVIATQQAKMDDMQKQISQAQPAQEALSTLTAASAMQVALHATTPAKPAVAVKGAPPVIAPEALAAYLADKGALVFVATHMAPAPVGKTYELWLLPATGQSPIPAGTFKPDAQGGASVVLPKLPKGVQAKGFGVTVENDGGSSTPTLPIVMS